MIQRSGDQSYLLAGFKEEGSVYLPEWRDRNPDQYIIQQKTGN
jgi:hypothetical protein